jgi:plasmid stabilization system protein ParE
MNNNPGFEVVISDAALAMLDSHMDFLANVSVTAAKKLLDEILDDIASLSEHPMRFPAYQNQFIADSRYRRMLSAKRYLVIYEVDKSTVFVDYIVDCRQDFEWLIR